MITFVIPTLWKSKEIYFTLESFKGCDNPHAELIVVDNANSNFSCDDSRVRVIKPSRNIFVNPSWNLGVAIAENDYVCFLNDDISMNVSFLLGKFDELIQGHPDLGLIGAYEGNYGHEKTNDDSDVLELIQTESRGFGFGCMMITKKDNYINIPKSFKIFFGDDYLFFYNKEILNKKNYYIRGLKLPGTIETTSIEFHSAFMDKEYGMWNHEIQKLTQR